MSSTRAAAIQNDIESMERRLLEAYRTALADSSKDRIMEIFILMVSKINVE